MGHLFKGGFFMSEHLEPLDQLYLINAELMRHGDKFSSPIITVGGQAVHGISQQRTGSCNSLHSTFVDLDPYGKVGLADVVSSRYTD